MDRVLGGEKVLAIEAAIVASMDLGKLVLPESIEAVYKYGDDVAIVTPGAIITIPREIFLPVV